MGTTLLRNLLSCPICHNMGSFLTIRANKTEVFQRVCRFEGINEKQHIFNWGLHEEAEVRFLGYALFKTRRFTSFCLTDIKLYQLITILPELKAVALTKTSCFVNWIWLNYTCFGLLLLLLSPGLLDWPLQGFYDSYGYYVGSLIFFSIAWLTMVLFAVGHSRWLQERGNIWLVMKVANDC